LRSPLRPTTICGYRCLRVNRDRRTTAAARALQRFAGRVRRGATLLMVGVPWIIWWTPWASLHRVPQWCATLRTWRTSTDLDRAPADRQVREERHRRWEEERRTDALERERRALEKWRVEHPHKIVADWASARSEASRELPSAQVQPVLIKSTGSWLSPIARTPYTLYRPIKSGATIPKFGSGIPCSRREQGAAHGYLE